MAITTFLKRIQRIDQLIRIKATGIPKFFNDDKKVGEFIKNTFNNLLHFLYQIILSLPLLFVLLSCDDKSEKRAISPVSAFPYVYLFFDSTVVNNNVINEDGSSFGTGRKYELAYINDSLLEVDYIPNYGMQDTLVIALDRDFLEIEHVYRGVDKLYYLFEKGDSVVINYKGKRPFVQVLNRETLPYDLNYEILKRTQLLHDEYPSMIQLSALLALFNPPPGSKNINLLMDSLRNQRAPALKNLIPKEYEREGRWLDSLKENDLISEIPYQFYKSNLYYDSLSFIIAEKSSYLPEIESILQDKIPERNIRKKYRHLLHVYISKKYIERFKKLSPHSKLFYKSVFDSIQHTNILSNQDKNFLLTFYYEKIMDNYPLSVRKEYTSIYKEIVDNKILLSYIEKKYNTSEIVSNELELMNYKNETTNLSYLLNQYKGKVLYVDFWASWCAPCIRAFPASHQLQNDYKNKDVEFIFISIDEDMNQWKKGMEKYELLQNSYIVNNKYNSKMLEELQVQSIPRYLLYDKSGKLVHKNALGPDSEEIRKLLDHYL